MGIIFISMASLNVSAQSSYQLITADPIYPTKKSKRLRKKGGTSLLKSDLYSSSNLKSDSISKEKNLQIIEQIDEWNQSVQNNSVHLPSADSAFDLSSREAGVQSRSQDTTSIAIRGSSSSSRVLTVFDGAPLNSSDGFGAPDFLLPKEVIRSASTVKGPSSSFLGANAMGGAVLFKPRFLKNNYIEGQSSTNNDAHLLGIVPVYRNRKSILQASAFVEGATGEFAFDNSQTGSTDIRENNDSILQRYTLLGRQKFGSLKLSQSLVFASTRHVTPGPLHSPQPTEEFSMGGFAKLGIEKSFGKKWKLSSHTSGFLTQREFDDINNIAPDTNVDTQKFTQKLESKHRLSKQIQIDFFGDYQYDSSTNLAGNNELFDTNFDLGSHLYWRISPNWSTQTGFRYLATHKQFVNSAAVARHFDSSKRKTKIWLHYSEGFRSPTLPDRFSQFPGFRGNPDLIPENSQQVELGFGTDGRRWQASLTGYYIYYSNFINFVPLDANNLTAINSGSADSLGIEANLRAIWRGWQNEIGASLISTENLDTGEPILLTNDMEVRWSLSRRFFSKLLLGGELEYWGESFDRNGQGELVSLSPGFQINSFLSLIGKAWRLKIVFENINNQPREKKFGFPEKQRSISLSLGHIF